MTRKKREPKSVEWPELAKYYTHIYGEKIGLELSRDQSVRDLILRSRTIFRQTDGLLRHNKERQQKAMTAGKHYRAIAAELTRQHPSLAGNMSAQARAVMKVLDLSETQFRNVRRALSPK
jgi:hypothetical protein